MMYQLPEGVESTFRFILIAAKRAEQLIGGARPRMTTRGVKPTSISLEELMAGAVPWHPVTAEEYELLKQEDVLAREREEQTSILPSPLPLPVVAVVAEPEADLDEDDEFDEDLDALDFDESLDAVEAPTPEELLPEALEE